MEMDPESWVDGCGQAIQMRTAHMRMTPRRLVQSNRPSLWKARAPDIHKSNPHKERHRNLNASKNKLELEPRLPVVVSDVPGGYAISLDKFSDDIRDWRKLRSCDVVKYFQQLWGCHSHSPTEFFSLQVVVENRITQQRQGLMAAVCVGILQAVNEGAYWAPQFDYVAATKVEGVRVPMSRIHQKCTAEAELHGKSASSIDNTPKLIVFSETSPLDACVELAKSGRNPHIALLRFSATGDASTTVPSLGVDFTESELFLRTTYGSALQELQRHVHSDPVRSLETGGIVYTTDVAIVREPIEVGAAWLSEPFRVDIIWLPLQRRPDLDSHGDYGHQSDRRSVGEALDRAVRLASSQGVEALVLSPPGIGSSGDACVHPPKLIGKLLREAVLSHGQSLQEVRLCWERGRRICQRDWNACVEAFQDLDRPRANCDAVFTAASLGLGDGWEQHGPMSRGWMRRLHAFPPPKDWRKTQIRRLESARNGC